MSERIDILTPVGRLVQGDCFKGQDKDAEGRPLVIKNGPNAGQPRKDFFFAVAIPKTDPGLPALQAEIVNAARQSFPTLFDAAGACAAPQFAFKMIDGDSAVPNTKGSKPCDREGFPGHVVFYFSSGFAPKCFTAGGASVIVDPEGIKRGYFIRVSGSVVGNGSLQQPGVFLNHNMVELVGYGEEISSGPDGATVFGGAPAGALPAGASATPLAGVPLAAAGAVPAAGAAVQPAADFLNPPAGTVPPATGAPAPAPAPAPAVASRIAADGVAYTEAQLVAAGYTPEQIAALPVA